MAPVKRGLYPVIGQGYNPFPTPRGFAKSVTLRHEERYRIDRVIRGGSWNNNPNNLRVANRNNNNPDNTNNNIGFRCAAPSELDARVRGPNVVCPMKRALRCPGNVPVSGTQLGQR